MNHNSVLALLAFAFVTSITPGPNNLMLMASGANFGLRRTVPHMLGVGLGFVVLIILVGIGLVELFDLWPASYTVLKVLSIGYMLWLAWKIGSGTAPQSVEAGARPLTFLQAAAFQWVNPKALTMALSACTVYAPNHDLLSVLWVAGLFGLVNFPCVSAWAVVGEALRKWLSNPRRLRLFNWTMAAMLVASLAMMI